MKKRLLAMLCVLALCLGVFVMGVSAQETVDTYQVGYAKVDVSPWIKNAPGATLNMVDENGNEVGFAYNADWNSKYVTTMNVTVGEKSGTVGWLNAAVGYSGKTYTCVLDGNGDGKLGVDDGIAVTATSVTDDSGKTVLFLTIDAIGGKSVVVDNVKNSIATAITNAGGKMTADCIYVSASHSHRGMDMTALASSSAAPIKAYWNYYKQQIINAAVAAYENRTASTMSKGQIDVSDTVDHKLTFIRHYNSTTLDQTTNKTIIKGSNFCEFAKGTKSHVYDAVDMMYLLQFTPTNGDEPIVLMNWSSHGTMVGGTNESLSADYIGSIRSYMKKAGYRFAFLQGAGGNSVPESGIQDTWKNETDSGYSYAGCSYDNFNYTNDVKTKLLEDANDINHYAYLLRSAALSCLNDNMQELTEGEIRTVHEEYVTPRQKFLPGQIVGAKAWNAAVTSYINEQKELGNTVSKLEATKALYTFPYAFEYEGETYTFDGYYQLNSIYNMNATSALEAMTENAATPLNAIMLGDQVAMLTSACELSDRYSATDALEYNDATKSWQLRDNDNDWEDLINEDTYGTPFVLSLTNGSNAYLTNSVSFTYNAGSGSSSGGGSYESHSSPYAKGVGEALIVKYSEMLEGLNLHVATCNGKSYTNLGSAFGAAQDGDTVTLISDVAEAKINVEKNLYLDLNGYDIKGRVVVANRKTLYCYDNKTDDYTVTDDDYGRITAISGTVTGKEGYVKIAGSDGTSFHKVDLDITSATLRCQYENKNQPGVYYTCGFKGDEMVAEQVVSFGVALSIQETPDAGNLKTKCAYSSFDNFSSGAEGNCYNSTLLYGIMKETNADAVNQEHADTTIYGRAYIETANGYYFGEGVSSTFRELVQEADKILNSQGNKAKRAAAEMYTTFFRVMHQWDLKVLPKISQDAAMQKEDGTLKVLVIGNSHGLDATRMLYEVFSTESPEQDFVIANLYIGGGTVLDHATYFTEDTPKYEYHKNGGTDDANGNQWTITKGVTGKTALLDEQWDVVIMQQMNYHSAMETHYVLSQFQTVKNYVKAHQAGTPEFMWHMVWANPDNYELYLNNGAPYAIEYLTGKTESTTSWRRTHETNFPGADGKYSQSALYEKILECTNKYILNENYLGADITVLPSATAIQHTLVEGNRTQSEMFRDYTHLSDYGRLIVAYTWYAKLMDKAEITQVSLDQLPGHLHVWPSQYPALSGGNIPVDDDMKKDLLAAVNWALSNPFSLPEQQS